MQPNFCKKNHIQAALHSCVILCATRREWFVWILPTHKATSLSPQWSSCSQFATTIGYVTEISGRRGAPTASFQASSWTIVTADPVSINICDSHCSFQPLIESKSVGKQD